MGQKEHAASSAAKSWGYLMTHPMVISLSLLSAVALSESAGFRAKATGGINIHAKCTDIAERTTTQHPPGTRVFHVAVASCDTGNRLRNRHMLEDLDAEKHPEARLEINGTKGKLTVRGVTRDVALKREGDTVRFAITLSEFGVPRRTYLGFGVQDEVEIEGDM